MNYCFDTNALILHSDLLDIDGQIIIPEICLHELDKLKMGFNDTAYRARQAVRKLKTLTNVEYDFEFGRKHPLLASGNFIYDDIIVECAKKHEAILVSGDYLVQLKAKSMDIQVYHSDEAISDNYSGYLEVNLSENEIATFYENLRNNTYNLLKNQYLVLRDLKNELVDLFKWNGEFHSDVNQKGFTTNMFGKFKPFDEHQVLALDSMNNNQMTMIKGKAGSGKSLVTLNYAWQQIEKGKYDQLVIFSNPVASKNSAKLGFYPGTRNEKLLNSQTGTMLSSKFGSTSEVERQILSGKLTLLPFSDIRGFDTTGMKAIVWFIESQNLDVELMKTGIQRCGDDSKVIIDGDYYGQVDSDSYSGFNNGMRRVSEVYKGQDFYGEVELVNIHRSKLAMIADLM
jgi:predicted ribonuclease YlaK